MSKIYTEEELKEIANQLANPNGEFGLVIADNMNENNIGMTLETVRNMDLSDNDEVLELGHGNCGHLKLILQQAKSIHYRGLEISSTMHQQASTDHKEEISRGQASFLLYDGLHIPFQDNLFDKILSVNTLYFWEDIPALLAEIRRVLKPQGCAAITFADRAFMETLPFTKFGFNLFDLEKFKTAIAESDFILKSALKRAEYVNSKTGDPVLREYWIAILSPDNEHPKTEKPLTT
ncbi:class I SAM-dependent methyltransferase [Sphingobacterium spiritivorum]|uniref:class I SAM-dependent methyltransferase n=1 Tax=Sphingobacterium spiritivorum TaxID=258 RepID=UPI00191AECF9|nr:class I SAM-dependent methyltransferase [Sphingobacterium spiritivorum]QQT25934.1 class I SAM-dependent methyltransferase [Sphingobacterium spiritivorum]